MKSLLIYMAVSTFIFILPFIKAYFTDRQKLSQQFSELANDCPDMRLLMFVLLIMALFMGPPMLLHELIKDTTDSDKDE